MIYNKNSKMKYRNSGIERRKGRKRKGCGEREKGRCEELEEDEESHMPEVRAFHCKVEGRVAGSQRIMGNTFVYLYIWQNPGGSNMHHLAKRAKRQGVETDMLSVESSLSALITRKGSHTFDLTAPLLLQLCLTNKLTHSRRDMYTRCARGAQRRHF